MNIPLLLGLLVLAFAFLFGGASRQNELRVALVELAALPVLAYGLITLAGRADFQSHRFALAIAGLIAAIPAVQLIPLPPAIWLSLPGRDQAALALDLSGLAPGWTPATLAPDRTWTSLLALVPPFAMLACTLGSDGDGRKSLAKALLLATLVSVVLGAAQIASGTEQLYLWATTAAGHMVGFFANRNHMATLCLMSMPFAAVIGAAATRRRTSRSQHALLLAIAYVALLAVAIGVIRSRAGVVLFVPVLAASLLAAWVATGRGRPKPALLSLGLSAAVAIAAVAAFALPPLLARFDSIGAQEGRFENWPVVLDAAAPYLPIGSGIGSFDPVFRSIEPLEELDPTFFNQAHNDYLETWLETGWLGIAVILVFLVWFSKRLRAAWGGQVSTACDLQRASSIAIGVVLLHSTVDYPLRTLTIATLFALCCGLLEFAGRPTHAPEGRRRVEQNR